VRCLNDDVLYALCPLCILSVLLCSFFLEHEEYEGYTKNTKHCLRDVSSYVHKVPCKSSIAFTLCILCVTFVVLCAPFFWSTKNTKVTQRTRRKCLNKKPLVSNFRIEPTFLPLVFYLYQFTASIPLQPTGIMDICCCTPCKCFFAPLTLLT
jgi:hypothetical protein